ncbi:zinc finger MYM-type protein 4-like [Ruditapes philippinarum]|uniref:zinc finger MYM-type protein 4-like n=1 Tax=Ruditapes philippinarum TaxID=129788 RepID=UPI00295A983F|nr:zinc finger MYM-type protein 4-like [Ruditapes philippinarum]
MSQESNIELDIEIDNEEDEFLANIDFHLIEAAMILQQDDESVPNNVNENEPVVLPSEQDEDVSNIINIDGINKNTKFKTDQDIKLFQEILVSVAESRPILQIPPEELSAYVSSFIYAVRKKDGQEYEPNSLISKFQSIQRFLNVNQYGFSLSKDQVFQKCKQVLKAKTKHLKSQGKGNNPNAAAKFYAADQLGGNNPRALQNSMWFICTNFIGMRTGTEVHSLCWGDVKLMSDDDGSEYLVYCQERQTKTRTGAYPRDQRKIKPRAYEVIENPARCPVALYKQFANSRQEAMLEPNSPFFLTVASNVPENEKPWYKKCTMGINKIYSIMKDMKHATNIDKPNLTPYSVRKGMVQTLNYAGVAPNHIIQISGHKNVNIVNNYSTLNESQQKDI